MSDLKTQMRGLLTDNEEIKQTQEEVNTTLLNMNHHLSMMAEAIDRYKDVVSWLSFPHIITYHFPD